MGAKLGGERMLFFWRIVGKYNRSEHPEEFSVAKENSRNTISELCMRPAATQTVSTK